MYIFDGEIHKINEQWYYAIEYVDIEKETIGEIEDRFLKKYKKYMSENQLEHLFDYTKAAENFQMIYRPSYSDSDLMEHATFGIKFKIG